MKNLIAIAVLVVLGVIAYVVFREPPVEKKDKVVDAIQPVDLNRLDTIRIERFEGTNEDRKKEKYTLVKKGEEWRMTEPVDYAVVQSTVDSMTKSLGELRVIDIISEKKDKHEQFEVDEDKGVIVEALAGKDVLAHFIMGNAKGGVTFARLPGKDAVYRLKGQLKYNFNKGIRLVRDKTIVKVEFDDISKASFETGEETFAFEKSGAGNDATVKPVGVEIKNFDESKAKGVLRTLARLNAVDFEDTELPVETTGLGEGAAKVTIEAKMDGKPFTATLFIGNKKGDKSQNYLRLEGNKQLFLISNYTAKRLIPKAEEYSKPDEKKKKGDEAKTGGKTPSPPSGPPTLPPGLMEQMRKK